MSTLRDLGEAIREALPAGRKFEVYNASAHPDCGPHEIRIEIWYDDATEGAFQNTLVRNALRDRTPAGVGIDVVTRLTWGEHEHRCSECGAAWVCGCSDSHRALCKRCRAHREHLRELDRMERLPSKVVDRFTFAERMRRRRAKGRASEPAVVLKDETEIEFVPMEIPESVVEFKSIAYGQLAASSPGGISKGLAMLKAVEDALYTGEPIAEQFDGLDAIDDPDPYEGSFREAADNEGACIAAEYGADED